MSTLKITSKEIEENNSTNDNIDISPSVLNRRNFFKKSMAYSVSAVAAASVLVPTKILANDPNIMKHVPWGTKLGDPVNKYEYGIPSPYEHNNVRRASPLLSSGDYYGSITLAPLHESMGIISPNGLFFTRSHGGVAHVDPSKYRLMIHGLVEKPIVLTYDQLKRYPSETRTHFIECPANGAPEWRAPQYNNLQFARGMMSAASWTGVKLSVLLKDIGVKPSAKWCLAEGSDNSEMGRTIPVEKIMDDAMIVWGQNGEALRPEQGYPVRLLLPGWEGNMQVKWLKRLEFADKPWHSKEETSKYTMLQPGGKAIRYFWPMEVNSVITSPCPEKPWTDLKKGDMVEISGLAWSGLGTIKHVDISINGGKDWTEASLKGLVLPKSWTRFSFMYKFDGNKSIIISSRATDDVGRTQPTIDEEVDKVGVESIYHRNSILSWEIKENGEVNNVHLRKKV